ncbi:MAG: aminoglycoside phosphotransferase family protein [Caldilineaceae bacterium]
MIEIPAQFARTMHNLYDHQGRAWLDALPALVDECAQRWSLRVQPPFAPLSYNYVLPATRADGSEVVLKLGVPNDELTTEIEALRIFDGRGIVQLLFGDAIRGILLLERVQPGAMLLTVEDDARATEIAADVMQLLWRPAPQQHRFAHFTELIEEMRATLATLSEGVGPFPKKLVETAQALARDLLASPQEQMVLHGDFHHYNVLSSGRAATCDVPWLAIDPKGRVGERACEVGALLHNPDLARYTVSELKPLLARRIDILTERLQLPRERLVAWGVVYAMISACWSYEEDASGGWEPTIACAEALALLV